MPDTSNTPNLVEALLHELETGVISIAVGIKMIEVLQLNGYQDRAAELMRRWPKASLGDAAADGAPWR